MPDSRAWRWLDRELVQRALAEPPPEQGGRCERCAAVSVLLSQGAQGVELLLIRRSVRTSDPWSGHMALPGGHWEAHDASLLETAIRETREEIGLDLSRDAELLGTLDDVTPASPARILVRPFVFALDSVPALSSSPEVDQIVWADLAELASGSSVTEHELLRAGQRLRFPGFRVGDHVVWGLTYRVLTGLLERAAGITAFSLEKTATEEPSPAR
ncbi:MAG TPA: CoA pyrophosphatase [Polyangiaceae bacterium]